MANTTWKPWNNEDDLLDQPTQVETITLTDTLSNEELVDLLSIKLADVLNPPTLDQAIIKFRQLSRPNITLRETLQKTRKFCMRITPTTK